VDLSIVLCTHNRAELLTAALTHHMGQHTGQFQVEIIVVDNNSTDDTAAVVARLIKSSPVEMKYIFEAAQGISYARNTGWRIARGSIIAFTDDDVMVSPDWGARIVAEFAARHDIDCVGGKVLPDWPAQPPTWLTRDHWAPLAILDYGNGPLQLDNYDARCLIGANFAFRREALERIGGFSPAVQRVKDGIGSIEDHEFLIRFWEAGGRALYVPAIVVVAPVDRQRLEKAYHRKWHYGHGHFHAIMRSASVEHTVTGRFLDIPAHLYRKCAADAVAWMWHSLRGRTDEAFRYEKGLRFFWGFFTTRSREYLRRRFGRPNVPQTVEAVGPQRSSEASS
jgi:glycosyltransferase involved in cell wall biosynthesis